MFERNCPGINENSLHIKDHKDEGVEVILNAELDPGVAFGLKTALISGILNRRRLFWSYKVSMLNMDIGLNRAEKILGNSVSSFKTDLNEHTLSAGLEHTYGQDKRWILEGGYGVKNNLLTAKVSWYRKYIELGLNIYPESVFIMQPEFNIHFNF